MARGDASEGGFLVPRGQNFFKELAGRRVRLIFERGEAQDHLVKSAEIDSERVLAREPFCEFPGEPFHIAPCQCQGVAPFQRAYFL
jgi:hypothetical protein